MAEFIEQQVEAKIVAALATALPDSTVLGWWQPVAEGVIKRQFPSGVLVTVMPRANAGFGSAIISLNGSVYLRSAVADDPDCRTLAAAGAAMMGLLEQWNAATGTSALDTALGVSGVFRPDGFIFTDGGDAGYDDAQSSWFAAVTFQIKGCIL